MSEEIFLEVKFFLISIACGILMLVVYDVLRIFRRIIRHGGLLVAAEDLLFWIAGGVFIFDMIYKQNYGIIRSFSILGLIIGMLFYHNMVSDKVVSWITRFIKWILKLIHSILHFIAAPFLWIMRRIKWGMGFIGKKLGRPVKYLLKRLKKTLRTVKISVSKK